MLFMLGGVPLDTAPFNIDEWDRSAKADFAVKPVIGAPPRREFMGEGEDMVTLRGQLLPTRIGGLNELEALHGFRRAGRSVPVMRGDDVMMGWFVILSIEEKHESLGREAIGFTLTHTISLAKDSPAGASPSIIADIQSLFGLLGR